MTRITMHRARSAKAALLKEFRRLPNLADVGIAKSGGDYVVKVRLTSPMPEGAQLPGEVDGVPVAIEVADTLRKRKGS